MEPEFLEEEVPLARGFLGLVFVFFGLLDICAGKFKRNGQ